MGDEPDAVRAAARALAEATGGQFATTGEAPSRRGPGLRVYGSVHVSIASEDQSDPQPEQLE
jgi:hypothetical protein